MQYFFSKASIKVLVIATALTAGSAFAQRDGGNRERNKNVHVWNGHQNPKIGNTNQNPPHRPQSGHQQMSHPAPNPTPPTHGPVVGGPGGPIKAPVSYSRSSKRGRHN